MIGIIDTGGGMRDVYGAGVFDWLMDNRVFFPYTSGVSAGSANVASYLARQRGRNLRYYANYSERPEYMGVHAFLHNGSFFNLNYIYSELADEGGQDPIDMQTLKARNEVFCITATDAATGKTTYFGKNDLHRNDMTAVKASCAIPMACKPVRLYGREYVDGGVSMPIPFERAFQDGCSIVFVILTRPLDYMMQPEPRKTLYHFLLRNYPKVAACLDVHHQKYNRQLDILKQLASEGRVVLIAPSDSCGVENTCRDSKMLNELYKVGYADAGRIMSRLDLPTY